MNVEANFGMTSYKNEAEYNCVFKGAELLEST